MLNVALYKNLNKALAYLTIVLSFVSCNNDKQSGLGEIVSMQPAPSIVPLNSEEGYIINPVTGDSIQPLINSIGDTLVTGVPVPAKGRVLDPRSLAKPKVVPAGKPKVVPVPQRVHKIQETLTIIPVNKNSLKTFTAGVDTSSYVLINYNGDTIPTGVPRLTKGKVVPCRQPKPVMALPPQMKDYASINVKYMDLEQGMNSSTITSILEDSRGNIWIGTQRRGVSLYSGESFTYFTQNEGLSSSWITSIIEDRYGNIWICTAGGGVNMYDGESFTHYTENEGLCHNIISSILEDSHGNLWFGSWGGGVSKYDGSAFTHFSPREGLSHDYVFSILEDSLGNIWFGTWGGGVSIYDGKTFTYLTHEQGLTNDLVWSLLVDDLGNIWIGTDDGLNMYNGINLTQFTEEEGLCNKNIRTIFKDSHGNLWFGTHGGVSKYDGKTFTDFTQNEGLSSNRIRFIMEDHRGNIWFGTENGGVSIFYGEDFSHFAQKDGLSEIVVNTMLEDSHGNLWFGTWGGGVNRYDGERFVHYTLKEGLISNIVSCILEDSHGNLWFGTRNGGVCMYNGETFTYYTKNEGLSDLDIRNIFEDSCGNLWFSTHNRGVCMYDGKTFTHFTKKEGLIDNRIRSILEDSQGNLWFGGYVGVSKYDGENFTHYTQKEGLSGSYVNSMLEDSCGNIWLSSYLGGGVSIFNGEAFMYITQNEGLSDNWARCMAKDLNNDIWISTQNGLNRILLEQETDSCTTGDLYTYKPVIYSYGLKEGMKGIGMYDDRTLLSDRKNRLWLSTDKGLTMLDVNNLKTPAEPPVLQLNRIDLDGQFVDYRNVDKSAEMKLNFDDVPGYYNYPINLELPHGRNNLAFYFSPKDWYAAQKIKYSFVMEGLDDQWNAPTAEANAVYRNMPHGRYTFKVRAIGAAQKWSEPFEYSFRIMPPLWLTWWAYLIYGFILLLLIRWYRGFLIIREKINADLRIKEVEVSKMQELDQMKSRFFANISHEFRTPLALIQGPIEDLKRDLPDLPEKTRDLLQFMKRNTIRLQHLINQILDISKLETGKVKLQVSEGNLEQFIRTIALSFLSLAESKKIKYTYDLQETSDIVLFDNDKLEIILTNLISNAFKFTPEGGKIRVSFKYFISPKDDTPENAIIEVADTGRGIPQEKIDKIFDRFYQVSDSDSRIAEGTGLGLALTKELVDLYRGEICVDSEEGRGSKFTVRLPVLKESFSTEERVADLTPQIKKPEKIESHYDQEEFEYIDVKNSLFRKITDNRPVILIVEDNADLSKYISLNLERKYRVLKAINGTIGLDMAVECIPDLIISDVMMPVMDGLEMSRLLKIDERTNHIPIIMLTAKADLESKLEGLRTGADDYLVKPFDIKELKVRVKNLIEQRLKLREKFRKEFSSDSLDLDFPPKDHFLKRLFDIFDQHISDPEFTMNQLAGELFLSLSQVQRKVMAITNYTPNELFRNHRLKNAATLFRNGHTHVAQVMHRVGFNNQSYFTKCFGEFFEKTPSQFIAAYSK